jgi:hypothetical protein
MWVCVQAGTRDTFVSLVLTDSDALSITSQVAGCSGALHQATADLWRSVLRDAVLAGEARSNLDIGAWSRWLVDVQSMFVTRVSHGELTLGEVRDLVRAYVLPGLAGDKGG